MSSFVTTNRRRRAVDAAQNGTADPRPAGKVTLEREPCAFGVPRAHCHVGCGRSCRRANDGVVR